MALSHNILRFDSISLVTADSRASWSPIANKHKIEMRSTLTCHCPASGIKMYEFKLVTEETHSISDPNKCIQNFLTGQNTSISYTFFSGSRPPGTKIKLSEICLLDTLSIYAEILKGVTIEDFEAAIPKLLFEHLSENKNFIF